jgi:hypothetical protein
VAIAYLRDPTIAGKVIVAFDDNYVQRASFGGWLDVGRNGVSRFVPLLRPDENGSALVVTHTDGHAASLEYQRALLTATIGR